MDVSVIIVNYNNSQVLKNCLTAFSKYKPYLKEVIVIDNDSSDDSVVMIRNNFPEIKLLINQENQGFARASNLAAAAGQGELLFFLNPDTLIQEDIFKPVIGAFEKNNQLAVLAPKLVLPDGREQPWASGRDWVSGAALFIRKNIFEKTRGFDENFFMYFEDRDFCRRVKKIGWEIKVMPEIKVVHLGGQSWPDKKSGKRIYYQSQSYYWRKKYGLLISLFLRMVRWPYKIKVLYFLASFKKPDLL